MNSQDTSWEHSITNNPALLSLKVPGVLLHEGDLPSIGGDLEVFGGLPRKLHERLHRIGVIHVAGEFLQRLDQQLPVMDLVGVLLGVVAYVCSQQSR